MIAESVASQSASGTAAPSTADERRRAAKAHLKELGLTIATWADRHGYNRRTAYKILSGTLQGNFGVGHNIAVRLGIKHADIDPAFEPPIVKEAARG